MPAPAPAAGDELRAAGLRRLYPQDVGLWKRHCARREDGIGRDAWRNCVCNVDVCRAPAPTRPEYTCPRLIPIQYKDLSSASH